MTQKIRRNYSKGWENWLICLQPAAGTLVAQRLKRLPPMRETRVQSLGQEDPLEKEMVTHSNILAWRIPWTEKPGRLQSTGSQRVGHDWATSLSAAGTRWGKSPGLLKVTESWATWLSASVASTGQWDWSQEGGSCFSGLPASQVRVYRFLLTQGAQPQSYSDEYHSDEWWYSFWCSDEYHEDRKMKNRTTETSMFYKNFTETNTQLASLNALSTLTVTKFMLNSQTKIFKLFSRWTML